MHEQQKERGASAVFLTTAGQTFGPELRERRQATDAKRSIFQERFAALRDTGADTRVAQDLRNLEESIAKIGEMRQRIDTLSVSRGEQVAFYTAVNHQAIGLVGKIAAGVSDPEVAKGLLVYSALLYGKDTVGIDRAIGASGFAAGGFNETLSTRLVSLKAAQDSYFNYILKLAPETQAQSLETLLSSAQSDKINVMHKTALSNDPAAISVITASDWFDTQTSKIGSLKGLEDSIAKDLIAQINAGLSQATQSLALAAGILFVGFAAAIAICIMFICNIKRRIRTVVEPIERLADGDLNITIPDFGETEFGPISKAMAVFHKNALDAKEDDKKREIALPFGQERKAIVRGDPASARAVTEKAVSSKMGWAAVSTRKRRSRIGSKTTFCDADASLIGALSGALSEPAKSELGIKNDTSDVEIIETFAREHPSSVYLAKA